VCVSLIEQTVRQTGLSLSLALSLSDRQSDRSLSLSLSDRQSDRQVSLSLSVRQTVRQTGLSLSLCQTDRSLSLCQTDSQTDRSLSLSLSLSVRQTGLSLSLSLSVRQTGSQTGLSLSLSLSLSQTDSQTDRSLLCGGSMIIRRLHQEQLENVSENCSVTVRNRKCVFFISLVEPMMSELIHLKTLGFRTRPPSINNHMINLTDGICFLTPLETQVGGQRSEVRLSSSLDFVYLLSCCCLCCPQPLPHSGPGLSLPSCFS